ncbi:DsbA family protein [Leptolyngbya sp. O-77]|uniref:DsbA family protein n=1 Tax=Leptolyngbya sp. O-77 TaxID=1080068 RepID=UPI00074D445B|nr:DsbA family protein [Leptolyngbya sp. O-77]BAU43759.1 DSBA-like thioredoxin domain protein [Leptolyngbya sp. O-77]
MTLPQKSSRLILPVGDFDHCQGSPAAKFTLVQYGDYQCPSCRIAHRFISSIQQQLGEQLRFVFRHFPQSYLHPEAHHAAEAAEAAASQNKFWDMHIHLLQHQSQLADSYLVEYAMALYLDVDQFLAEMANDCHTARIQSDIESGVKSGVVKTPTFFINGLKYGGEQHLEKLLEAIVQANFE